ncbi:MAG: hypothetical protein JO037_22455, partial [Actinobacteria bacterium]|nr:hypothetical protein [Actinomycetota bacterium]
RLEAQLSRLDVDVTDVTHVIVTPFQPYALGNLLALPDAAYCLSRTGWIDFHAPRCATTRTITAPSSSRRRS